ncbi:hypothetical protein [Azospirillum doebereinerae]|uniref:HEPN AbiU2-like domain-containing protein n=1 Tax=Azospirillum doebereinerae TaxID=92933 RepID=A0A3S0X6H3_9PROT|nr:hypothetical protein [Azospirillum doebereinerae]RUQ60134.1 hypothetical protein EJ913_30730 [Azospirillum doebereinerae]
MIVSDVKAAIQVDAMHKAGNEIVGAFMLGKAWYEAHGYNIVLRSLITAEILALNRIYDWRERRPLHQQNKASIPVVLALLEDDDTLVHFQDEARLWNPGMGFEDHNAALVVESIGDARSKWEALWQPGHDGRAHLDTLRAYRDSRVAHVLVDVLPGVIPQYSHLPLLLLETLPIIKPLALALTGIEHDFESMLRESSRQAEAFWRSFLAGAPPAPSLIPRLAGCS